MFVNFMEISNNNQKVLTLMEEYEIFSKSRIEKEVENHWHINNSDIKWHANYIERFEGLKINDLYAQNEYARQTRWNFWNFIVELFLHYNIKTNLDIGCANNQFAFLCNSAGIFSLGIDPRESCVNVSKDVFESSFGQTKFGYVGTLKTFVEFFKQLEEDNVVFDCISVLNFLHGDHNDPYEIEEFFNLLPKITNYALLSEPKWDELNLPKLTDNYSIVHKIDNGTIHTFYKVRNLDLI